MDGGVTEWLLFFVLDAVTWPLSASFLIFGFFYAFVWYPLRSAISFLHAVYLLGTLLRILFDSSLWGAVRFLRLLVHCRQMRRFSNVTTYEEWRKRSISVYTEQEVWREKVESPLYDWVWVVSETEQFRRMISLRNVDQIEFSLRGGILNRHHCRLDNPRLHSVTPLGTKYAIESYFEVVEKAMELLAYSEAWSVHRRLKFFRLSRVVLGRTALCLSGGGALAICHAGVVKELLVHSLLPRVISGTSGGAIVAAYLAIYPDDVLLNDIIKPDIASRHGAFLPPVSHAFYKIARDGFAMKNEEFESVLRKHFGAETFESAFLKSRRHVSITVTKVSGAGASQKQTSMLLNHVTSPSVLLWSAVAASCALPGLIQPVVLMMVDPEGKSEDERAKGIPAFPGGVRWRDGSILADIPLSQMRRQFGVNQFIVTQTNPHVSPFSNKSLSERPGFLEVAEEYALSGMKRRIARIAESGFMPNVMGQDVSGVFYQQYNSNIEDSVIILPDLSPTDLLKMMSMPDSKTTEYYISLGEKATWPKVAQIRQLLRVEKCIEKCIKTLIEKEGKGSIVSRYTSTFMGNLPKNGHSFDRSTLVTDVSDRLHLDSSHCPKDWRERERDRDRDPLSFHTSDDSHVTYTQQSNPSSSSLSSSSLSYSLSSPFITSPSRTPSPSPEPSPSRLSNPSLFFKGFALPSSLLSSAPKQSDPRHAPSIPKEILRSKCHHSFDVSTFSQPTWCALCGAFIYGLYTQGKTCTHCNMKAHHGCAQQLELMSLKGTGEGEEEREERESEREREKESGRDGEGVCVGIGKGKGEEDDERVGFEKEQEGEGEKRRVKEREREDGEEGDIEVGGREEGVGEEMEREKERDLLKKSMQISLQNHIEEAIEDAVREK